MRGLFYFVLIFINKTNSMEKDSKILNEVHKMKNLMKYMGGEKLSPKQLKENYYEESEMPLEEGVSDNYSNEVKVNVNPSQATINGNKIEDAEASSIKLSYIIEIEGRQWGIKGISLYAIEGPSEIELQVSYYPPFENEEFIVPENLRGVLGDKISGNNITTQINRLNDFEDDLNDSEQEVFNWLYEKQKASESEEVVTIKLPLNWDDVNKEEDSGTGLVTVGEEIDLQLANNEKGELYVSGITVPVYTL